MSGHDAADEVHPAIGRAHPVTPANLVNPVVPVVPAQPDAQRRPEDEREPRGIPATAAGPEPDVELPGGYHVEVHGSVAGHVVVGDHNLIVNAAAGSSVQVLQEAQRPRPVRRERVRVLPRRPAVLIGRETELGAVAAAVVSQTTMQVYGPAGIGKSTLLRQAAYDLEGESDGVVFIPAGGRSVADIPQEIFEACYETSGYRPGIVELRRLMAGQRVTVFVDDVVCGPDELLTLLDAAPAASFVLSAPERELYGEGQVIELHGLSTDAATALARRELGRDLTAPELAELKETCWSTAGSPMALLREIALIGGRGALSKPEKDVAALLRYVGRARVSAPVLAALAGAPDARRAEAVAERLVAIGGAEQDGYAYRAPVDSADQPHKKYRRNLAAMIEGLLGWLTAEGRDPRDVAAHADLIVELVDGAVAEGRAALGCHLARTAAPVAALSLRWAAWRDILTSGLAAAKASDDREAVAYFTHERGIRMLCLGQAAAAAVLGTAAALWTAIGLTQSAAIAAHAQALAASAFVATGAATGAAGAVGAASGGAASGGAASGGAASGGAGAGAGGAAGAGGGSASASGGAAGGAGSGGAAGGAGSGGAAGAGSAAGPLGAGPSGPGLSGSGTGGYPGPAGASAPNPLAVSRVPRQRVPSSRESGPEGPASPRTGFPWGVVTGTAVVVIVLVVAGILIVPKLTGHGGPVASTAVVLTGAPGSPSTVPTTAVLPAPVAFSDMTLPDSNPANVLDDDPATIWSSKASAVPDGGFWIGIDMGGDGTWTGVSLTPRPRLLGFPVAFRIQSSDDGVTWTDVPGETYSADNPFDATGGPQALTFPEPVRSRYVRLYADLMRGFKSPLAEVAGDTYALQIAEFHVIGGP